MWPLFTGWVSLSEYRNGRSLSGYAHLMQNADLTWAQDLGAVTELLSGEFFRWFGRSTSHQLWSSAMVVTPTLRGMFGLEWDAAGNTLSVTPNLPAQWDGAKVANIPIGNSHIGLDFKRNRTFLSVRLTGESSSVKLDSRASGAKMEGGELRISLPAVEVGIAHGLPAPGAITSQMKVLEQTASGRSLKLRLSAPGDSTQVLFLRINDAKIHVRSDGAEIVPDSSDLKLKFPPGNGYVEKVVSLSW